MMAPTMSLRMATTTPSALSENPIRMPSIGVRPVRLGFVGTGWTGQLRLQSVLDHGGGNIMAVADPDPEARRRAVARCEAGGSSAPRAFANIHELLDATAHELDGVVIATPSHQHAEQATVALAHGLAVFCQKPLARTADETMRVVEAARLANRRLSVDFSYRGLTGVSVIREAIGSGSLGTITLIELVFHNAYGPDKSWYYTPEQSGGGCVMDLGCHLVDLLHHVFPMDAVRDVLSARYIDGTILVPGDASRVEDFAAATLRLASGATAHLTCSWRAHAGRDADIQFRCYGTQGGLHLHNRQGSFTDFELVRHRGTTRQVIGVMDASWMGSEITRWVDAIAAGPEFAADEAERLLRNAVVLDALNGV